MDSQQLSKLPNIGKVVETKLILVRIETQEQLKEIGSEQALICLKTVDKGVCLNMLCALEGAIQGARWHQLSIARKRELKEFLNILDKQK